MERPAAPMFSLISVSIAPGLDFRIANSVSPTKAKSVGASTGAAVSAADAGAGEALSSYASSALWAYLEVESALTAEGLLREREQHLAMAAEQSRAAERLAGERYRSGIEGFITVLESQRRAVQADSEWIAARRSQLENRVDLYLALGGGFGQASGKTEERAAVVPNGSKETRNGQ